MNLLVGPNASGKTNILEAVAFLKRALIDASSRIPYRLHVPWYWEATDIIYIRDPTRAVVVGFEGVIRLVEDGAEAAGDVIEADLAFEAHFTFKEHVETLEPFKYVVKLGETSFVVDESSVEVSMPVAVLEEVKRGFEEVASELEKYYTVMGNVALSRASWREGARPRPLILHNLFGLAMKAYGSERLAMFYERLAGLDKPLIYGVSFRRAPRKGRLGARAL